MLDRSTILKNLLLVSALGALASMPMRGVAQTLERIRATQTISLAHREASLPFSYVLPSGKPVGYSVDICLKLVETIKKELKLPHLKVEYVPVTPTTRIATVVEGRAALECGSTTNTTERQQKIDFTIPHFFASTKMLVRSDAGIRNWSDLKDKKVVTTKGTTTIKLLLERDQQRALHLRWVEGRDHGDSFAQLDSFAVDAFVMDDVLLYGWRASSSKPERFAVVGDALSTEQYAIMLLKGDVAFKNLIDKEMARMMESGDIARLYDKWFKSAIPPKGINLMMPMSLFLRDTLRFPSDKLGN